MLSERVQDSPIRLLESEEEVPDAGLDRQAEMVRCVQAEAHSKRCWAQEVDPTPEAKNVPVEKPPLGEGFGLIPKRLFPNFCPFLLYPGNRGPQKSSTTSSVVTIESHFTSIFPHHRKAFPNPN